MIANWIINWSSHSSNLLWKASLLAIVLLGTCYIHYTIASGGSGGGGYGGGSSGGGYGGSSGGGGVW